MPAGAFGATAGRERAIGRVVVAAVLGAWLGACGGGATGTPSGAGGRASGGSTGATGGAAGSVASGGSGTGGTAAGGSTDSAGASGGGSAEGGSPGTGGSRGGTGGSAGAIAATGGAGGTAVTGAGGRGSGGAGANGGGAGGAAGGPPVVDLFNGTDLTGFNVYKATSTANNSSGTLLAGADAQAIFKPENGMIHVYGDLPDQSTQVHYLLQTVASYSRYNLSWDYKWGVKKFAPYTDLTKYPRDAGVLWHIHGDKTQVWPSSIEFQNKWGSTGDIFALYAQCKSLGAPNDPTQFADSTAGGTQMTVDGSTGLVQHMRAGNFEMPGTGSGASTGVGSDWNSCLLQVDGGTATYVVNGHVVNRVLSVMDKSGKPVTAGPIAWQAEQAEVFYRNLRIQVIQ